jgi:hypothetical protein
VGGGEAQANFDESNVATGFVPESEKSSFLTFVKKAMGGIDLSRITAPPFILAPQSQLETNAELMSHPHVFSGCAHPHLLVGLPGWLTCVTAACGHWSFSVGLHA